MYVLLDIIYNHSGNNWFYRDQNGNPAPGRAILFELLGGDGRIVPSAASTYVAPVQTDRRLLEHEAHEVLVERELALRVEGGAGPLVQRREDPPRRGRVLHRIVRIRRRKRLGAQEVILSCQGGGYTTKIYPRLRAEGWQGYWIDAASTLRMDADSVIVLDPVNRPVIDQALEKGCLAYIGGNCTVSLMMMAMGGLLDALMAWDFGKAVADSMAFHIDEGQKFDITAEEFTIAGLCDAILQHYEE